MITVLCATLHQEGFEEHIDPIGQPSMDAVKTRPARIIADAMFHAVMGPAVTSIEARIHWREQQRQGRTQVETEGVAVIWADDLALPVFGQTNEELNVELEAVFTTISAEPMRKLKVCYLGILPSPT